ncbi:DUF6894 family protein [Methylobacterium nigriterrae]|uniref:DUF6894 family protein n=1 Tax=Methylobacterium nigriterrae TaxID=3127512 RepID=UPI0030140CC4
MPRYFFDIQDGTTLRDNEGLELPDVDAVRVEAHRALAELAMQAPLGNGAVQIRADVRDSGGAYVLSATLLLVSEVAVGEPKDG